ncbi:MAG: ATP-dependent Clp protease ATP-binding subunit ClpX, partial [Candidatus Cloacimonadota bacterium]|nr:ATP-dependent Clp protease ATP-binding subunit ClpX [Candidatus Cloacimonadota bacterium]
KNALSKQYKALFALENVSLKFTDDALEAIAEIAMKRESGARGLRAIMESIMIDIMYQVPDLKDVRECYITKDVIAKRGKPIFKIKPDSLSEEKNRLIA